MVVKQKVTKLCDDMITFWQKLKEEVEAIPNENEIEIICKWDNYFQDNYETIGELSDVKNYINIYRFKGRI